MLFYISFIQLTLSLSYTTIVYSNSITHIYIFGSFSIISSIRLLIEDIIEYLKTDLYNIFNIVFLLLSKNILVFPCLVDYLTVFVLLFHLVNNVVLKKQFLFPY